MSASEIQKLIVSMKFEKTLSRETLMFEGSKIITLPQGTNH